MQTLKYGDMLVTRLGEGIERRLAHTEHLMLVVMDFDDGPTDQPDPFHSHPHEQVSYVVEGEILFVTPDQQVRLGPGDVFLVPSDQPHAIQRLTRHVRLVDCFTPIRQDFLK